MSDIDRPPPQHVPAPIAHRCHCGNWAGFGFSPQDAVRKCSGGAGNTIHTAMQTHALRPRW
jgi:hypothetical protein